MNTLVHAWWWLEYHTGLTAGDRRPYLFWSGFGSDLGEITILTMAIGWYRVHKCHVTKCHRFGKHRIADGPYVVCKKHHPNVPDRVAYAHVLMAHRALGGGDAQ